jgi:hypothetical protein
VAAGGSLSAIDRGHATGRGTVPGQGGVSPMTMPLARLATHRHHPQAAAAALNAGQRGQREARPHLRSSLASAGERRSAASRDWRLVGRCRRLALARVVHAATARPLGSGAWPHGGRPRRGCHARAPDEGSIEGARVGIEGRWARSVVVSVQGRDARSQRPHGQLRPRGALALAHGGSDVSLHRPHRDAERAGDRVVAQPLGDAADDLQLPLRQRREAASLDIELLAHARAPILVPCLTEPPRSLSEQPRC